MERIFSDRAEAGRALAARLFHYRDRRETVVLGLPRGGVPVAYEVAVALGLPLDVFCVRKLGVPGHEELALGAIASGGVRVMNQQLVSALRLPPTALEPIVQREMQRIARMEARFRDGPALPLDGRCAIVVDDGVATGATMRAAAQAVRQRGATRVVAATPVAAADAVALLAQICDEVVAVLVPDDFLAVGRWYRDFTQTTDDEVRNLLSSGTGAHS